LSTPLGQWLHIGHQSWHMFVDPASNTLYQQKQGSWFSAPPRTSSAARYTRSSSRPTYDLSSTSSSQPPPRSALPTALIGGPPHRASVSLGPNSIPSLVHSAALASTVHPYYEQLLNWKHNKLGTKPPLVAASITNGDLHICPDGSYVKRRQCGSHSWIFSKASRRIIFRAAAPAISHPRVMSAYRAELSGITSVLFIIYKACMQAKLTTGTVIIYCDNQSALDQIFNCQQASRNPYAYLKADIDLITCA